MRERWNEDRRDEGRRGNDFRTDDRTSERSRADGAGGYGQGDDRRGEDDARWQSGDYGPGDYRHADWSERSGADRGDAGGRRYAGGRSDYGQGGYARDERWRERERFGDEDRARDPYRYRSSDREPWGGTMGRDRALERDPGWGQEADRRREGGRYRAEGRYRADDRQGRSGWGQDAYGGRGMDRDRGQFPDRDEDRERGFLDRARDLFDRGPDDDRDRRGRDEGGLLGGLFRDDRDDREGRYDDRRRDRGEGEMWGTEPGRHRDREGWQSSERGPHAGRGPRGYRRSDERIRDDVNERLEDDPWIDASDIDVRSEDGVVTLEGKVDSRDAKRRAEEVAASGRGVHDVMNRLRVERQEGVLDRIGDALGGNDT